MRSVTYVGLFDAAEIEVAPGVWVTVDRGDTVEVADNLAKSLLEQVGNWQDPDVEPEPDAEPEAKPKRTRRKPVTDTAAAGDKE